MGTLHDVLPVRLAVQSSRRLFSDALVAYFSTLPDLLVVGHITGVASVVLLCTLRRPDVMLLDAEARPADAFATLAVLRRCFPLIRVVLVYERLTAEQLGEARRAGATVLVPSTHGLEALLAQLRQLAPVAGSSQAGLTERELEIIMLLGCGHSVPEIAALLGIAAETVENHKRRIYAKLQAKSAVHAVARAAELGLLPGAPPATRPAAAPADISARECEILESIAVGHTVRQTARALGIAPKTVENTQARLFGKLGVRNRAGALAAAYSLGLLQPSGVTETRTGTAP